MIGQFGQVKSSEGYDNTTVVLSDSGILLLDFIIPILWLHLILFV